jgi:N-methylhydantoinase B
MSLAAATNEVVRSYLASAAEEMRRTLIRTAFNPVIYEVLDFGISIYDENLDLIADAPGLALFIGANDYAIRRGVEHLDRSRIRPGDIVLMNYPYWNSAHAMDVTLFAPVFASDEAPAPFAWTCIRAHWMDLGAKDPGYVLDSTDVQQEGLLMPCLKVYKAGVPDPEIFDLIRFNSRMPDLVIGDLEAQVAATRVGTKRLQEIYAKFGRETFRSAIDAVLAHGERITRERLAALPHGTWTAEDWVDDDGLSQDPVLMRVKVTIDERGMACDFTGSAGAVRGPINMPFGLTETVCKFVLKSLTTPESASNAGQFRPLTVTAPPGSLFHAVPPAPTFTLWTAHLALELLYKALAAGMPDRLAASSGGDVPGFMMVGHDSSGALYAVSNNDPVGWGGTAAHDGANATNHLSGCLVRNTPIEVLELRTGMFMESFELLADSGGAGRRRGGLGTRRSIRFVQPGEFLSVAKKTKTRPWGLAGGEDSAPTRYTLFPGTAQERDVGTSRTPVAVGERIVVTTAGGAGYGPRWERPVEDVLADVADGYVSERAALDDYGVAVAAGRIDARATDAARARLARGEPATTPAAAPPSFEIYDLKVEVVAPPGGAILCGAKPGDSFTVRGEMISFPPGQSFSLYSLAAVLPLLPAKQRPTDVHDWMTSDGEVACPDPNCSTRLRITRTGRRRFERAATTAVPLPGGVPRVSLAPGYEISRLIKGGWQLAGGHGRIDPDQAIHDMARFVEAGITAFDCADIYTGVEETIGRFRRRYPELARHVRIHTKFVPDLSALATVDRGYVERVIDRSLARLGLECLDLVQFHWWDYSTPRYVDVALELARLRERGKIRLVGATNFDVPHLAEIVGAGVPVASHQVQYSVLDDRPAHGMVEFCAAHGIALLCFGTVAGGFLGDRWRGQPEPTDLGHNRSLVKYKLIIDEFGDWAAFQTLLETLAGVGRRHGCDVATVATRWVLDRPGVAAAIVGATNAAHLTANVAVGALTLTAADRAEIDAVLATRRGPSGDVYELERDRHGPHGRIMKYELNT